MRYGCEAPGVIDNDEDTRGAAGVGADVRLVGVDPLRYFTAALTQIGVQ